ncbi:hypothetical protein [Campylobacter fetus]|uniref:hypothetical protein n=4 Tax=Campylobacter fetus TaxID=196 RepID=UPI0003C29B63|nr:hypothetical protein [Campylobacter fetus]AGZ82419.1 hypothetical protein CFT03427_1577 [Campylobacter fetus subsp. testudinum 03-427]ALV65587.1 hypothetical membrane protein [Campylobacter fetus subsp. testudinum Sp3]EAI4322766.1 hypothetical protein [Campylobacter fetus]EAI4392011.1 hypothetical protein [Campylobacter fetus]MPB72222.1 hypothetical protein [Campylobacter fetus]
MSKIFIYPSGLNAKILAFHIEKLYNKQPIFIDDSDYETSIENRKKIIKNDDIILLASKTYEQNLISNLEKFDIENYCDGISLIAKKLNKIYKNKFGYSIGVILEKNINDKYLNIPYNGYELNSQIVYFTQNQIAYEEAKKRFKNVVMASSWWLSYFDFVTCYISSDYLLGYNMPDVKTFVLGNYYYVGAFHDFYHSKEDIYEKVGFMASRMDSFTLAHAKEFYENLKPVFSKFNNGGGLLKLGYKSIESDMKNYVWRQHTDTIIIPIAENKHYGFKDMLVKFAKILLENGFRVLFKAHYQHKELLNTYEKDIQNLSKYQNFVLYTKPHLSLDELERSITLVEFRSSLNYTYALITKKPSILLIPPSVTKNRIDLKNNFYNKNLHIELTDLNSALQMVKILQNDSNVQKLHKKMIEYYIQYEMYSYDDILEFIQNYHLKQLKLRQNLLD